MHNKKMPKKLLRITDLTFVLPDDFSGDVRDALKELTGYMCTKSDLNTIQTDTASTIENIFKSKEGRDPRLCMMYGIFESDDDGNYALK